MQKHDVINRARAGDAEAFAEVFEALRPKAFAVAGRLVGFDAAHDVVMEAYLKAWHSLPGLRGTANLGAWLYRIVHNCAIDYHRRRVRLREVPADGVDFDRLEAAHGLSDRPGEDPARRLDQDERARVLDQALSRLPRTQQTVLLLRYAEELSYAEIAAATGVAVGTVMSRLFNAKRKLSAILAADGCM